jgi:hypothetical protein
MPALTHKDVGKVTRIDTKFLEVKGVIDTGFITNHLALGQSATSTLAIRAIPTLPIRRRGQAGGDTVRPGGLRGLSLPGRPCVWYHQRVAPLGAALREIAVGLAI